jgi:hypothetical protein
MSNGRWLSTIAVLVILAAIALPATGWEDSLQREPDQDGNGLPDALEMRLANEFAPIVFYYPDEPNLPTRVDRFLPATHLWFFSQYCHPQQVAIGPTPGEIPRRVASSCRASGESIDSHGTRSAGKASTFYLESVSPAPRRGSSHPQDWVTYVHSYRNDAGGVTLQYWRFYAFNTSYWMGFHAGGWDHGGDWEAIHVVLGPGPSYSPIEVRLLGHSDITTVAWDRTIHEGSHVLILCGKGGHTSELMTSPQLARRSYFIEQQSWTGGDVRWPRRPDMPSGPLVILGQKTRPMPGMEWIQYSGLWGSRENSGILPGYRSGYWGPAFNETGMGRDGFITAWCEGMASDSVSVRQECYASKAVP